MVKSLFLAFIVFISFNFVYAQEHYYWANGEKHFLELYPEKQYVLVEGQNKASIAQELGVSEQNITDLEPIVISRTINSSRRGKPGKDNLHWGVVDRFVNKDKIQSPNIIYTAPFFLVNGKEVGLSQYFYVKLKNEKDFEILDSLANQNQVEVVGNDTFMPMWYVLSCDKYSKGNALALANLFYETGHFSSAQPDLMEDLNVNCTNDPLFNQQWHLNNTGQSGGTIGNDIKICQAWNITMGCPNIVVAVLDHGLEFNHPDFANISPISFDSETGTSPSVVRGNHGVPVAGVIGASTNNNLGVAGVAPGIQLMSISNNMQLAPLLSQRLSNGLNFAWQNGAAVINNSWSNNSITQQGLINDAINNAVTQGRGGLGTIVFFSSGNESNNSINYPSNNPQVISVGAIGRTPSRAGTSNYGTGLDVVAPGVSISTTDRQGTLGYNTNAGTAGNYTSLDGTSFAAPQVAGIAALLLSVNPGLTLQQIRNAIERSADKVGNYTYTNGAGEQPNISWNNQMGYGKVNALKALQEAFPITGPSLICSSGTYILQNQPVGTNITWSSSNTNGLNINPTTGAATRLNNFNGEITITATINAACGPSSLNRSIWVGNPGAGINTLIWTGTRGVNPVSTNPGATYIFNVDQVPNATSYTWVLPSGFSVYGGSTTTTSTSIYITTSMTSGTYTLYCRANNACGSSWTNSLTINNSGSGGGGPVPLVVYPNPASSSLIIQDESKGNEDFSESSAGNPEYVGEFEIQLLDNNGRIRKTGKSFKRRLELNTTDIPDGQYILEIRTGTKTDYRHIIIKH